MTAQDESSFLESFGRTIGDLRLGLKAPLMERAMAMEFEKEKRKQKEQQALQSAAIEEIAKGQRWQKVVADYEKEPLAEGAHGVRPEWDEGDALRQSAAYGRAGLDPEAIAKAQKEKLLFEMLQKGSAGITNPIMQANLGLGKELNPVELKEGNYFNPYDTENFQLGTTAENQQEVKKKTTEADEVAWRLKTFKENMPTDSLMAINALNSKELGKPMEAVVEGPGGESHQAIISQDPSGGYHYAGVTDKDGNPMVIPPEAAGSGLTTDQKNVAYYSKLWGKTLAETAEILKSKSLYSDAGFIESRLTANTEGRWGRNDDVDIFNNTFSDFTRSRYGSEFPDYFINLVKSSDMKEDEKVAFIDKVDDYNQTVFEMQLAGKAQPQPGVQPVAPQAVASTVTPAAPTQAPPVTVAPVVAPPVMNTVANQPPRARPPEQPPMPAAAPMPTPLPELPPLPEPEAQPFDINKAITIASQHTNPADIRKALAESGMTVDDKTMGVTLMNAINSGQADPADMNFLAKLLGIDLKMN